MNSKIALLSDQVINQIAAGEVIEHPASAVKELVDNALDAGAKRIAVAIEGGGHLSIQVEDDGFGMNRADAHLCLLRHATSKISDAEDLQSLTTMGFRGEALAAIASISKLEIKTSDGSEAVHLRAEAGRILEIEGCARNRGTTVAVRSLFFNAPARRKFQKSQQASSAQIAKIIQSLALSHPQISFSLLSHGEKVFAYSETDWKERIKEVLGEDFCEQGIWIEEPNAFGFLGSEAFVRKTRTAQHFFLNRRPIFSPLFAKALKDGYGTRIAEGMHPAAILFFQKNPEEFDVNVHPQKKEVRFRDEPGVFCELKRLVQAAFLPRDMPVFEIPGFEMPRRESTWVGAAPARYALAEQEALFPLPPKGRALAVLGTLLLAEKRGRSSSSISPERSQRKARFYRKRTPLPRRFWSLC